MRRKLTALVALGVLAVTQMSLPSSVAASASIKLRNCPPYNASHGLGAGPYAVRVRNTPCPKGKRVARIVVRHGERALAAWACAQRRKGPEGLVTTCRCGSQIVRFFSGA